MNSVMAGVKREYWEHRNIIVGLPLVISALCIIGATVAMIAIIYYDAESDIETMTAFGMISAFIGVAWLAGFYFLLSCLYTDRKDKSVLFWKSLPVSETRNVLTKFMFATVGFVVVSILFAWLTCAVFFIFSMVINSQSAGQDAGMHFGVVEILVWPLVSLVMGVAWGAPLFAYVLMVSAVARRSPFLLLILPPVGLVILEGVLFDASYILSFFANHSPFNVFEPIAYGINVGAFLQLYFIDNGLSLLLGLIIAAGFLATAVWFRNNKFEI